MNRIDLLTVNTIRTLAADAVEKAKSGHPGMAIGAAPIALAVFEHMKMCRNSYSDMYSYLRRDRFILSSGHASMLEYAMLHLFGYDVTIDDIKSFRQMGSKTAGHPEYRSIWGIEATTGPLGQGFAMAVGMAMAEKHMAAVYNRPGFPIFDNYTFTLMGDGCMMEGITGEAASIAGNLKLNKLIAIYDSNRITIEGSTDITFTENVEMRYKAYGWSVIKVMDGEDIDAIRAAIAKAKRSKDKPTLIIVHTNIAQGTPKQGLASSHGSPLGQDNIDAWKKSIGWDYEAFTVPEEVSEHLAAIIKKNDDECAAYSEMFSKYLGKYCELGEKLLSALSKISFPDNEFMSDPKLLPEFDDKKLATRACGGMVLNKLNEHYPYYFGGSADLAPSNNCELKQETYFSAENPSGKNVHYGVREFAMAAISNGLALYGGVRPFCATFAVFSDYLKAAARLSALMHLNVVYILTHDSIGVGEDGPTHQPIEQIDMFRATPNTFVFRPADGRETSASFVKSGTLDAPCMMFLSRQALPQLSGSSVADAANGGYIIRETIGGKPDAIVIATGSEVSISVDAAEALEKEGIHVRVVSMPCMELFEQQPEEYREKVLPSGIRARVAVEALGGMSWYKYTGLDGEIVSMKSFGASAPAGELFKHFGITSECVADAVKRVIG